MSLRKSAAAAAVVAALIGVTASYRSGGLIFTLVQATNHGDQSLEILRKYIAGWGPAGPLAYVALVIVEVLVAPIPGALLYAPGGAIFGGGLGGTLSLAGNVIGATVACLIAKAFSGPAATWLDTGAFARYRLRLVTRGVWIIFLLRLNPLTSSDLVSYAAGVVGMSPWKVAVGTLAGMAPLCYAQAYAADRIFQVLPGSMWVVIVLGLMYVMIVVWILTRGIQQPQSGRHDTDRTFPGSGDHSL